MSLPRTLSRAVRAIARESLGFRFFYPVEEVPGAGLTDSLHYYLWSETLFLEDMEFDEGGIPKKVYRRQGPQYNPLFIAWWGLHNLERHLRNHDNEALERSLAQIRWLKAYAETRPDGAVVWPCHFEWREGWSQLNSGWISAMYQSVVISLLVRGYRATGDKDLLSLAKQATIVFHQLVENGGVRTIEQGHVLFEEYPSFPLPRVLDGFMFSLLGLYDLAVETEDAEVRGLVSEGIDGLKACLYRWDYRGKWSWYGAQVYLCPPHYHALNYLLLKILGRVMGDRVLSEHADRWDISKLSLFDKAEVYVVFFISKNLARMRLPSN